MMPALLYLLKANGALLLVAAAYFGLLRRLTFFTLNRAYLVGALLFTAVYPALPMPALWPEPAAQLVLVMEDNSALQNLAAGTTGPSFDWQLAVLSVYAAGTLVLLARLLVQLLSLWRLRRTSLSAVLHGYSVQALPGAISPFSFGQTIYLNPAQHPAPELVAVLRHEHVHVRQWHTLDVLLAQVLVAAAWCNPAAWLLRRALLDNLEYLADRAALQTGLDRETYQYSLLRLSQGAAQQALASPFTFSTLKNRVVMMNMPLSSSGQLARYIAAGPLVLAIALGFTSAHAQQTASVTLAAPTVDAQPAQEQASAVLPKPAASFAASPTNAEPASPISSPKFAANPTAKAVTPARAQVSAGAQNLLATVAKKPSEQASKSSKQTNPAPLYYVDGELRADGISDLNPNDIASMHVFKGEQAQALAGEAGAGGVIIITTKQNQDSPEVQAFNARMGIAAVKAPAPIKAEQVSYLAAPALAYITKNYPDARLLEVSTMPATDSESLRYKALIAVGRRPGYLVFDGKGQFISELPYSH